jgi:5'-3' exonuclease
MWCACFGQAPGEAEAELAMLNARGTLDLVITDDVDCLLFGATKVSKSRSYLSLTYLLNKTERVQPQ